MRATGLRVEEAVVGRSRGGGGEIRDREGVGVTGFEAPTALASVTSRGQRGGVGGEGTAGLSHSGAPPCRSSAASNTNPSKSSVALSPHHRRPALPGDGVSTLGDAKGGSGGGDALLDRSRERGRGAAGSGVGRQNREAEVGGGGEARRDRG